MKKTIKGAPAIKEGDIVTRHSYNHDIYFKVISINVEDNGKIYVKLKGLDVRLEATASLDDLMARDPIEVCLFCYKLNLCHKERINKILKERVSCILEK